MTTIYIDNKSYLANKDESVLQVAIRYKIDIPHYCYHEDLPIDNNCRTCLVEIEGEDKIITSCTLKAEDGLRVLTNSQKVKKLRTMNMELLLAGHIDHCIKCQNGNYCSTAKEMRKYGISGDKFIRDPKNEPIHKMGTAAEFDPEMCIACNKCVEMCEKIGVNFLKLGGHDSKTTITYNKDPKVDCIYCGQCTVHCPVAAVREQSHIDKVLEALADPDKIVIVQAAPSIRTSIGESFDQPYGIDLTKQMYTAFRLLGFDKIFDVNMGADITTIVESGELVERIKEGKRGVGKELPMFTSCCPGWIKFLEFYYPEFIPNLTTARSPQIHSGGAYKTWWAEKEGIDPKNIVVVSVMPCTSKKYESTHEKLYIDGKKPVDFVLTTRELATILKDANIDLPNLEPSEVDLPGTYSGAAAIYGATGGVMESALRDAYYLITGEDMPDLEIKDVRGMEGIKRAEIKIGDKTLKIGVVATAANARIVLEELKKDPTIFDYVEFMACPGGCIGGGGQPIPSTNAIIQERINGLYRIDDKKKLRTAHSNPIVQEFMEYTNKLPKEKKDALLYTTYSQKKKFE